jgi:hypothetical protein
MKSFLRLTIFLALNASLVFPAFAQRGDKVASGRGVVVTSAADCPSTSTTACMFVNPTSSNTATFVNFGNAPDNVEWDLFSVATTGSVTFSGQDVGSFICGDGFSPADLQGFCTGLVDPDTTTSADFLNPAVLGPGNLITFSFISGATNLPAQWVFFADTSEHITMEPTATPESPTVALVGAALLFFVILKFKSFRGLNFQS